MLMFIFILIVEKNTPVRETRGPDSTERRRSPKVNRDSLLDKRQEALHSSEGRKSEDKSRSQSNNIKDSTRPSKIVDPAQKEKVDNRANTYGSDSEENDKQKTGEREKRKLKSRHDSASDEDDSYDSDKDDRKDAKLRKREERKLRKEKRRQKRADRRRRREERHSEKHKGKNNSDDSASDGEYGKRKEYHSSDNEETEAERQRKLEIELRNKALESLKAKKGISH